MIVWQELERAYVRTRREELKKRRVFAQKEHRNRQEQARREAEENGCDPVIAVGKIVERADSMSKLELPSQDVALALSGGGIRSATLSLGVLTSLSRLKLIHKLDYLSTVSGGGYTGAFYGSMFVMPEDRGADADGYERPLDSLDPLDTVYGKAAIRHLRDNGRYLLDNAGDKMRLAVIAMRNWVSVQAVIAVSLLAIFMLLNALQASVARSTLLRGLETSAIAHGLSAWFWPQEWLHGFAVGETLVLSPLWPLAALSLLLGLMPGWAYFLTRLRKIPASRFARVLSAGSIGTLFVAFVCLAWPFFCAEL